MSEIPYIAIDNEISNLSENDGTFKGTGKLVAPFTCYDISNEKSVTSIASQGFRVYVSIKPLYDEQYWLFVFKSDNYNDSENNMYAQDFVIGGGNFEFYYVNTRKPLNLSNINWFYHVYPFTYPLRQARTGVIDKVNIPDFIQENDYISINNMFYDTVITKELAKALINVGEYNAIDLTSEEYNPIESNDFIMLALSQSDEEIIQNAIHDVQKAKTLKTYCWSLINQISEPQLFDTWFH